MGHQRIGALPRSAKWREVIALLADGADAAHVASATFAASDRVLRTAGKDPSVHAVFFLLAQMPMAARALNPVAALAKIGVYVGPGASPAELSSAMLEEADRRVVATGRRSDLAELASLAACEALYGALAARTADLIEERSGLAALTELRTVKNFGDLTKAFLSRFLRRSLDYYLGRELPHHVGGELRFRTLHDHQSFDDSVERHCQEVAEITREYAGEWYSKALHEEDMTLARASDGLWFAFKKIGYELRLRE